jgi:S-(hydroxymethyl)glutathione dehydrogenase / alcohol dehydrogenase
MKAAVLYKTGESLVVEDGIEIPTLQPGQVLVKVAYSGVCKSQLMEVRGKRGIDNYLPHLLGHEASGTVVDTGKGVSKVSKNDKVILTWIKCKGVDAGGAKYQKGDSTINSGAVTTFSNFTVVSENRCIKLPDGIPMDLAPLLGCAVPTGGGIVMNTFRPSRENTLAIFGLGGIGLSAVMVAKALQCSTIIAVDIEDKKLEKAKELGATHLINNTDGLAVEKIKKLTHGEGVDYSIEAAGKVQVGEAAFISVKDKGGLCILAGHPAHGEKIQLDPFDFIKGKKIQGSWGGESQPDRDIPLLSKFFLEGKLPLNKIISHRFKLDEINQALDTLEKGDADRILIEMDD